MTNRPLQAVIGLDPAELTALLSHAVEDDGPALLPIDSDTPPARVQALIESMRPMSLRTPEGVRPLDGGAGVTEETALIIATSGSTGAPKGVELSSSALLASARASVRRMEAAPGDDWLCVLPTAHVSGLQVALRALVNGRAPVYRDFSVETAMAVAADLRPHVSLVPTQLRRLLAAGADLSLFRTILLGGAAAEESLLTAARAAGGRVLTTYGMSETCGGCVYDGIPLDGVDVALDADERILLCGPVLFSGYREAPGTAGEHLVRGDDGRSWFRTSDLGRFDDNGLLHVRGRIDDVINTGGHKVVAAEVASLLVRLDSVADAVVVGRHDHEWGRRVTAVVVPADPADPPVLEDLRGQVRTHLPGYAAPRELDLRSSIPLLSTGKPDLASLRRADPSG